MERLIELTIPQLQTAICALENERVRAMLRQTTNKGVVKELDKKYLDELDVILFELRNQL